MDQLNCYEELNLLRKAVKEKTTDIRQHLFKAKLLLTSETVTKVHVFNELDKISDILKTME